MSARFEYRIFVPRAEELERSMRENLEPEGHDEKRDLYLVDPARLALNLKLAGDVLEVKERVQVDGALERWQPAGEYPFPLSPEARSLFGSLPDRAAEDPHALVAHCESMGYRVAPVMKDRDSYLRSEAEEILGEVGHLTADGQEVDTVALESESAPALRKWVEKLGLDGHPNRSYVAFLAAR